MIYWKVCRKVWKFQHKDKNYQKNKAMRNTEIFFKNDFYRLDTMKEKGEFQNRSIAIVQTQTQR